MDSASQLLEVNIDMSEDELLNEDEARDVANSSFLNVDALKVAVLSLSSPANPTESIIVPSKPPSVVAEVETIELPSIVPPPTTTQNNQVEASGSNPANQRTKERRNCPICQKNHALRFCRKFEKMNLENRFRKVALHKICYRCLSSGHISRNCESKGNCKYCKKAHHFLLHSKAKAPKPVIEPTQTFAQVQMRQAVAFSPTLQVNLCFQQKKILVRSVLDLCCQSSYICADLVSKLKIPVFKINDHNYGRLEIESRYDSSQRLVIMAKVLSMNQIKTPPISVSDLVVEPFNGLQLADPTFNHSGQVALVLGPEVAPMIMKGRILQSPGLPLAQYTIFGWLISGLSPY